jgi:SAM-dependent methyltransferase
MDAALQNRSANKDEYAGRKGGYERWHPWWSLGPLATNRLIREPGYAMNAPSKRTKYPVRGLRYWFMHHLLHRESQARGQRIDVCEVGVDRGQMLEFIQGANVEANAPPPFNAWDGASLEVDVDALRKLGYQRCISINANDPELSLPQSYDAMVLLHILEHLPDPELSVRRLVSFLRPGGILIGGSPSVPDWLVKVREKQLRRRAGPFEHVSKFSPARIKRMAEASGLTLEFRTGAFCFRSSGSAMENVVAWTRFNLVFGAICPWWPGEVYWQMRKKAS